MTDAAMNTHPADWINPKPKGRYNLVVIGGGPAGIHAAQIAARRGAKVALIERDRLGGISLNTGCVPSKAISRIGRLNADLVHARELGAPQAIKPLDDFTATMDHMRRIQTRISRKIAAAELRAEGIDLFFGQAVFSGPDILEVEGQKISFRKALIATGSRSQEPDIHGLTETGYQTHETIFSLSALPEKLLVIGGGPLGCELAQAFSRLGSKVVLVNSEPKFLPWEERDAAQLLSDSLARDGIEIHLNTLATAARIVDGKKQVALISNGYTFTIMADEIVIGTGRAPNVEGMNLEAAEVKYDLKNGIITDDFSCTTNRRIYAAGDVCVEHKFTHVALATAYRAVQNALFFSRHRLSKMTIPWCTYTDPEIAHVGLYVDDANKAGISLKTFTVLMLDVDRAIVDGEDDGFVKIHVLEGTDRIMGTTIVARHAGEMINEISLAMQSGIGLSRLSNVLHAYPTQASAIKMAADACRESLVSSRKRFFSKLFLSCFR